MRGIGILRGVMSLLTLAATLFSLTAMVPNATALTPSRKTASSISPRSVSDTLDPISACVSTSPAAWGSSTWWISDDGSSSCTLHFSAGTSPDIRPRVLASDIPWITNKAYADAITTIRLEGDLTVTASHQGADATNLNYDGHHYVGLFSDMPALRSMSCDGHTFTLKDYGASYMFTNDQRLESVDCADWQTGAATDFNATFQRTYALGALDVSKWDTGKVMIFGGMFWFATKLSSIDVSKWDMRSATSIGSMFEETHSLTHVDVSKWDMPKVFYIGGAFHNAYALESVDVSNWNTSEVTQMQMIFTNTKALTSVDVSKWNTSKVQDMNNAFNGSAVTDLNLSGWNLNSSAIMDRALPQGLSKLTIGSGTHLNALAFSVVSNTIGWVHVNDANTTTLPEHGTYIGHNTDLASLSRQGSPGTYVTRVASTIAFDANGGSGAPASTDTFTDLPSTLPGGHGLRKPHSVFRDWNSERGGTGTTYSAGSQLCPTAGPQTLYAQWATVPMPKIGAITVHHNQPTPDGAVSVDGTATRLKAGDTVRVCATIAPSTSHCQGGVVLSPTGVADSYTWSASLPASFFPDATGTGVDASFTAELDTTDAANDGETVASIADSGSANVDITAPALTLDHGTIMAGTPLSGKALGKAGGTGEAHVIVTATWPDGQSDTTTSGADGSWSFTTSQTAGHGAGQASLSAEDTTADHAHNVSSPQSVTIRSVRHAIPLTGVRRAWAYLAELVAAALACLGVVAATNRFRTAGSAGPRHSGRR
ncbi:BspA family leucine-rich repeat surface protein [Bifidobacterium sp. ESL0763]|uniref:BspA family leucine-rich repeat surface protein n=1 Tax=Bifidobacterium sp. ESL0763 TaxID=2983227 RepID=UPI0023F7B0BE|nr:BspA family leucine-rich repeat surface protein [Bifidobacterium sp. ESL0763]MDF7663583.1 BspA family leucine-rich repeat surface protein [Bifidobacterium sp. ESL0763]